MIKNNISRCIKIVFLLLINTQSITVVAQMGNCNCDSIIKAYDYNFSIDSLYNEYSSIKSNRIDLETEKIIEKLIERLNDSAYVDQPLKDLVQSIKRDFGEIKCDLIYSIDLEKLCFVLSLDLEKHYVRVRISTREKPVNPNSLVEMLCYSNLSRNVKRIKNIPTDCIPEVHVKAVTTKRLIQKNE